jgi:uncharacterized membrane protein YdjX (TVP38/TMEM64 family)
MSEGQAPVRWWVWLIAGAIFVVLTAALIVWWQPLYASLADPQRVRAWAESLGVWGPLAIVLLQLGQVLLAPLPGQAIGAVSGYLYGPWLGTLYSMIGIGLGSLILFLLARRFGRPLAVRLAGKSSLARLDELVDRGGSLFIFLLWLSPLTPDELACLAAGLTSMRFRRFLILMPLGRLPGVFVSVWVGANVAHIQPVWWAVLFAGIALGAVVLWRWGERIQKAVLRLTEKLSDHRSRS